MQKKLPQCCLVIEKVSVNTLTTESMVGDLRVRSRVDQLHAVDGTAFRYAALLQRMTQIDGWFDEDILGVAQSTECRLPVCFRLLEHIFFGVEKVIRMVVVTAQNDIQRVFRRSKIDYKIICMRLKFNKNKKSKNADIK